MELNTLIEQYKALRTEREQVEQGYKTRMADLSKMIEAELAASGLKSAKTESGQAITSARRTVRVMDWDEFAAYAQENDPALIKHSIDNSEALRLLDDNVAIPGTEVQSTFVLTIK